MELALNQELEALVAEAVRSGRFDTPEALLNVAIRQYLATQEFGEKAANKLAVLREELLAADAQIERGEGARYDAGSLADLFRRTEAEALRILREKMQRQR